MQIENFNRNHSVWLVEKLLKIVVLLSMVSVIWDRSKNWGLIKAYPKFHSRKFFIASSKTSSWTLFQFSHKGFLINFTFNLINWYQNPLRYNVHALTKSQPLTSMVNHYPIPQNLRSLLHCSPSNKIYFLTFFSTAKNLSAHSTTNLRFLMAEKS